MVFDERLNLISILVNILKEIQKANSSIPDDYKIYARSTMHYGDVLDCQDVNDNKNFVGDGINVAAGIINETKKHQVLVSDEFYKNCHAKGLVDKNQYGEVFYIIDKHDNKITVRNYYDGSMDIGISI